MRLLLTSLSLVLSSQLAANEHQALTVDRAIPQNLTLSFPNDKNIKPKESDFEVLSFVAMSSEAGNRFCVVTLKNTASGVRVFEHDQLMALFADGSRLNPHEFKLSFKAGETQSLTLPFGHAKFPILSIYTLNR